MVARFGPSNDWQSHRQDPLSCISGTAWTVETTTKQGGNLQGKRNWPLRPTVHSSLSNRWSSERVMPQPRSIQCSQRPAPTNEQVEGFLLSLNLLRAPLQLQAKCRKLQIASATLNSYPVRAAKGSKQSYSLPLPTPAIPCRHQPYLVYSWSLPVTGVAWESCKGYETRNP